MNRMQQPLVETQSFCYNAKVFSHFWSNECCWIQSYWLQTFEQWCNWKPSDAHVKSVDTHRMGLCD